MEDEVVIIARRQHPLHRRRAVTLADLSRQRWVTSKSGSLLAEWLDQRWLEAGMPAPVPAVQTDSIATLLSLVASSDLITFHSWSTIRQGGRPVIHPPVDSQGQSDTLTVRDRFWDEGETVPRDSLRIKNGFRCGPSHRRGLPGRGCVATRWCYKNNIP